ncbi:MAG: ABC transporter permease [Flexilinea sp.]
MKSAPVQNIFKRFTSNQLAVVYVILLALLLIAQVVSPGYLQLNHLAGILRLASFVGIAAIGQNLAILTGGIDLSIANVITFANVISAQIMMGKDENIPLALLVVLIMGVLVGLVNGIGVRILKIPPFIMTLGVGTVVQGIFLIYTKGAPKGNAAPLLKSICGRSLFGMVSGIVIIWLMMALITWLLLKKTTFGRNIYSIGTNEEASRFSGIDTGKTIFTVYILSAVISALAGFFLVGYTGTSFLNVGNSYNTKTIAAVIIGGTAITGGRGNYLGTIAGAIIMTVLEDFLTILNFPEAGRQISQGLIILLLVLIYNREKQRG